MKKRKWKWKEPEINFFFENKKQQPQADHMSFVHVKSGDDQEVPSWKPQR